MEIVRSSTNGLFEDFSIFNGIVYLRGVTALDKTKGIADQTRDCFAQVDDLLKTAGTSKARLLAVMVYVSDIENKAGLNEAWKDWVLPDAKPTRATVEVKLGTPDTLIEIVVTAAG